MKARAQDIPRRAALYAFLFALLGGVFVSGCSKAPDDSAVKSAIESSYYADPALKSTNVQVVVTKGQVMLAGEVSSAQMKERAEMLAKATKGVKAVENRIAVAAPPPQPQPSPAAAATATVEAPAPTRRARKPRPSQPVQQAPAPEQTQAAEAQPVQQPQEQPATSGQQEPQQPLPPEPPAASQTVQVTIPAGSHMSIRMIDSIDSSKNQAGQEFRASLDQPIVVQGENVVPVGAEVTVRLATAKTAGRMRGSSELELQLVKLVYAGQGYPLVSNSYTAKGKSRGKDTAKKVGAGAAIGAVIGAIAGGGKGAAIGAAAGAGAGSAAQLATRGQQVKVPSETLLEFVLQQPVTVMFPAAQQ